MKDYSLRKDYDGITKYRCRNPLFWRSHRMRRRLWGSHAKLALHRAWRRKNREAIRSSCYGVSCE